MTDADDLLRDAVSEEVDEVLAEGVDPVNEVARLRMIVKNTFWELYTERKKQEVEE